MRKGLASIMLSLILVIGILPIPAMASQGDITAAEAPSILQTQSSGMKWYRMDCTYKKISVAKKSFTTKGKLVKLSKSPFNGGNQSTKTLKSKKRTFKIPKKVKMYGSSWRDGSTITRAEAVRHLKSSSGYEHGRLIFGCKDGVLTEMIVY